MPDDRHHEREQLFADLLAGDRSLTDPEVLAAMKDEDFRRQWDELQVVQARLDRAGEWERAASTAAPGSGADPVVAKTIARLAGVPVGGASPPAPATRRWVTMGLIAVAAALLAWLWLWSLPGDRRDDDRTLGPKALELHKPVAKDGGLELGWTSTLPDATFTVAVYDPEKPDAAPIATREESAATTWKLDAKLVQGLGPGLRWRVVAHVKGRTVERTELLR